MGNYTEYRFKEKGAMTKAVASNVVRCQPETPGNPVEAVIVFEDGSTRVVCPAEKGCKTAGLCPYERTPQEPG